MAPFDGNLIFYAVLIAPGFIAVMTAISLAAVEHEYSSFVLLVWSLVLSLIIDTGFVTAYQVLNGEITSFDQLAGLLFQPYFRVDYIGLLRTRHRASVRLLGSFKRRATIEDERISEVGTHDELVANGGKYAELHAIQLST